MTVNGFIFDLDGTLVDSNLDFVAMRREMGLGPDTPILEEIDKMDPSRAQHCRNILHQHELEAANKASAMPGVHQFLELLRNLNIQRAIVTRNTRKMVTKTLQQCGLSFETVIAREDGPVKPDPWAINHICQLWGVDTTRVVMVGDFRYDIEAGQAAGTKTVFFSQGKQSVDPQQSSNADFVLHSFEHVGQLLHALQLPI